MFFRTPEMTYVLQTMILGIKGLEMDTYKPPKRMRSYHTHGVNNCWLLLKKKPQNTYFTPILKCFLVFFTSPLFGGEIYTGNLLWTKYPLTFQDLGCLKKKISFRLDWKYLPSSNSDMWIFIKKLENTFFEYSTSIFCHEIAHASGLSTWLS